VKRGLRIGSLFAGIGGLELGLEWAGVGHTVWQVEIDPFCRGVLAKHWPDAQRFEDVRTVGSHNLESVDVICGGYPCQPFSIAGNREGFADPRNMWPEFARVLGELRPRFAVLENVADHLSLGFDRTLGDIAALGYDAEWSVVSACAVGAPYPRERVFCVAYTDRPKLGRDGFAGRAGATGCGRDDNRGGGTGDVVRPEWAQEPGVERVLARVPTRMERARNHALGNAVVPQVAAVVGRRLLQLAAGNP
jgi:DNA (cytosine-5)-methyltransferase 1